MPKFNIPTEDRFLKKVSIALFLLVAIILTGTLFFHSSILSYSESFIQTIELVTHVDVSRLDNKLVSIFLSITGYILQFYLLYVILEYIMEGRLRNLFSEVKMLKAISRLKGHYIICGGGRVGQHVADELVNAQKPYIILEKDDLRYSRLKKKGYRVLNIDVLDEKEFAKANVKNASWLFACLGDDGDNILLVLTTRELNPKVRIASRANHERIVKKLTHAGAIHIVCPEALGGASLAKAALEDISSSSPSSRDNYGIGLNS